jgi:hypothetical protein
MPQLTRHELLYLGALLTLGMLATLGVGAFLSGPPVAKPKRAALPARSEVSNRVGDGHGRLEPMEKRRQSRMSGRTKFA